MKKPNKYRNAKYSLKSKQQYKVKDGKNRVKHSKWEFKKFLWDDDRSLWAYY